MIPPDSDLTIPVQKLKKGYGIVLPGEKAVPIKIGGAVADYIPGSVPIKIYAGCAGI